MLHRAHWGVAAALLALAIVIPASAQMPDAIPGSSWPVVASQKFKVKGAGDAWTNDVTIFFGPSESPSLDSDEFLAEGTEGDPLQGTYSVDAKGKITLTGDTDELRYAIEEMLYDLADEEGVWLADLTVTGITQKSSLKVKKGVLKGKMTISFLVTAVIEGEDYSSKGAWTLKLATPKARQ